MYKLELCRVLNTKNNARVLWVSQKQKFHNFSSMTTWNEKYKCLHLARPRLKRSLIIFILILIFYLVEKKCISAF